jgi:hypothetical protein
VADAMIKAKKPTRDRSVFLVSGRDRSAHDAVAAVLQDLGLSIVDWESAIARTGRATPHAREVIEAGFSSCGAVVVLLSGDDEARLRQELCTADESYTEMVLSPQARPNVIFEAGLACALHPKSTVIVQVGRLRAISDLAGLQFVVLDGSDQSRRSLMNRLRTAGCRLNPTPANRMASRFPDVTAGLPPPDSRLTHWASLAILRAARSLLPFPRMDGDLELIDSAPIGAPIIVSLRLPDPASVQLVHWLPGAVAPTRLALDRAVAKAHTIELAIRMPGPAGMHFFDLLSTTDDAHACLARVPCAASED